MQAQHELPKQGPHGHPVVVPEDAAEEGMCWPGPCPASSMTPSSARMTMPAMAESFTQRGMVVSSSVPGGGSAMVAPVLGATLPSVLSIQCVYVESQCID